MGNSQSGLALQNRPSGLLPESLVGELGTGVLYERAMGSSRLFKCVRARTKHGRWVVKVFVKPDPSFSLKVWLRKIQSQRESLQDIPNVFVCQKSLETEKAGYMIRQWVAGNLYDRISTRPFLTHVEKKWIAFQLLTGLRDSHMRNVYHGDIKTENILITSSNWAYLSDFAPFKPVYLPEDNPSDFSVFFDSSGRRACCLAPERFLPTNSKQDPNATLSESMDIFGLGCVIAELFVESSELFTLSQLLAYRSGKFQPDTYLAKIDDQGIYSLIKSMISLDPKERLSADQYLENYRGTTFPPSFYTFFHPFFQNINQIPVNLFQHTSSNLGSSTSGTSTPIQTSNAYSNAPAMTTTVSGTASNAAPASSVGTTSHAHSTTGPHGNGNSSTNATNNSGGNINNNAPFGTLPTNADERIERIWTDFEVILDVIKESSPFAADQNQFTDKSNQEYESSLSNSNDTFPVTLSIHGYEVTLPMGPYQNTVTEDGPALIVLSLLCANMRNCLRPSTILRTFDLALALVQYLSDETKLDRLLPYFVSFLDDDVPIVRATALRSVTQLCMMVNTITPSNTSVFLEYIMPNLPPLVSDPEQIVRCVLAKCLPSLANTASRYLEITQAMKISGTFKIFPDYADATTAGGRPSYDASYDVSMSELVEAFHGPVSSLLTDPSPAVKRALLDEITTLCIFFGKARTNDEILSHMITYLNDQNWTLREAFFQASVGVSTCIGAKSLEEFILPLMLQSLSDREEFVISRVLASLTTLLELGLPSKSKIWEILSNALPLIWHPNIWIRQGAASFVSRAAEWLPSADTHCILYSALRRLLRSDISTISELEILDASLAPLPRNLLEATISWAMKPGKSLFWKANGLNSSSLSSSNNSSRSNSSSSPHNSTVANQLLAPTSLIKPSKDRKTLSSCAARSDEDAAHVERLRQLGLTSADALKVELLRDHIIKIASSRQRVPSSSSSSSINNLLEAQSPPNYGVIPQTILYSRVSDGISGHGAFHRLHQFDTSRKQSISPFNSPLRTVRPSFSSDQHPNIDELRRRLALRGGGSTASLTSLNTTNTSLDQPHQYQQQPNTSTSPNLPSTIPIKERRSLTETDRPASTSLDQQIRGSDVTSVVESNTSRRKSKINVNGVDVGRVTPAVAKDTTTATGVMNLEPAYRAVSGDMTLQSPGGGGTGSATPPHIPNSKASHLRQSSLSMTSTANEPIFTSTYDGNDPNVQQYLERVFLDSYSEPMPDFGRYVPFGVPKRRAIRSGRTPRDRRSHKPEGTLIAHLVEHTKRINSIVVSPDQVFFVTGSDDGTVKVWDTARIERSVSSKARQTLKQGGHVTCVIMLDNTHCIASASTNGTIMIHRVDVTLASNSIPKYGKQRLIRQYTFNDNDYALAMAHYNTESQFCLVCATSSSKILILDIRTMQVEQEFQQPNHLGQITTLLIDPKHVWLAVGTSNGYISFWDLRFGILLRSWRVGGNDSNPETRNRRRVTSCILHPTRGRGRWIMVASDSGPSDDNLNDSNILVETWNIENGSLVEVYSASLMSTSSASSSSSGTTATTAVPTPSPPPPSQQQQLQQQLNEAQETETLGSGLSPNIVIAKLLKNRSLEDVDSSNKEASSPAVAIERLLSMAQAKMDLPPDLSSVADETLSSPENRVQSLPPSKTLSNMNVQAMVAGFEYFPHALSGHVSGAGLSKLSNDGTSSILGESSMGDYKQDFSDPSLGGFLITGGEDRRIRYWSLSYPEKSGVVSGHEQDDSRLIYKNVTGSMGNTPTTAYIEYHFQQDEAKPHPSSYGARTQAAGGNVPKLHRSTLIAQHQQHILKAHEDSITSLALLDFPFRCIVSGDRSGVVKIFE